VRIHRRGPISLAARLSRFESLPRKSRVRRNCRYELVTFGGSLHVLSMLVGLVADRGTVLPNICSSIPWLGGSLITIKER
jgi:hypothetical protein